MKKATEWQNKIKKKPQLSESQMEMADVLA
jgi:hypothetical protein